MKYMNRYKILLGLASALLLTSLIMIITGNMESTGPLLILFFMALAFG
jgi:hypothetical protein